MTEWSFDVLLVKLALKVPYVGKPLADLYVKNAKFQRFVKYGFSLFVVFWVVRYPMMFLMTDVWHIWYALSAFISGVILAVVGFVINEIWVWRR